jgi:hypothetical protein
MGMTRDMKERKTLARVDDETRRWDIKMARDIIYNKNFAVDTPAVEEMLRPQSLVPTIVSAKFNTYCHKCRPLLQNAFSNRLASFGFNLYLMLVVDILHDFELGVWKVLFIHLIRMLNAVDKTLVDELDRRYAIYRCRTLIPYANVEHQSSRFRQVPTFGRDTIRHFSSNISELKKLAARDFEDILQVSSETVNYETRLTPPTQCAIPVFDGLFPEPHNRAVLNLLFTCAHWHGLAKLRMHTDLTLNILDEATIQLGAEFRAFVGKTCPAFDTRELRRETAARQRRRQKKATEGQNSTADAVSESDKQEPLRKMLNLRRYKYHALGDYADTIRRLGTTDSTSTELVSAPVNVEALVLIVLM